MHGLVTCQCFSPRQSPPTWLFEEDGPLLLDPSLRVRAICLVYSRDLEEFLENPSELFLILELWLETLKHIQFHPPPKTMSRTFEGGQGHLRWLPKSTQLPKMSPSFLGCIQVTKCSFFFSNAVFQLLVLSFTNFPPRPTKTRLAILGYAFAYATILVNQKAQRKIISICCLPTFSQILLGSIYLPWKKRWHFLGRPASAGADHHTSAGYPKKKKHTKKGPIRILPQT